MFSKLLSILLLLSIPFLTIGQSPYEINWKTDGPLLGGGIGVLTISYIIGKKCTPFDEEGLRQLNAEDVWSFDRPTTRRWSLGAQKYSDLFLTSTFALPTTLLLDSRVNNYPEQLGLLYLETLVINTALTNLVKNIVKRPRPFAYNPDPAIPFNIKLKADARRSYFSGHTSISASMSFLTAKMYSDFHPDGDARPFIWGTAALIPAVTGYLRVRGGKHFPTDVITGYVVGALVGILVPSLHK